MDHNSNDDICITEKLSIIIFIIFNVIVSNNLRYYIKSVIHSLRYSTIIQYETNLVLKLYCKEDVFAVKAKGINCGYHSLRNIKRTTFRGNTQDYCFITFRYVISICICLIINCLILYAIQDEFVSDGYWNWGSII